MNFRTYLTLSILSDETHFGELGVEKLRRGPSCINKTRKQDNWIGVVERFKLLMNTFKSILQTPLISEKKNSSLSLLQYCEKKRLVSVDNNMFSTS